MMMKVTSNKDFFLGGFSTVDTVDGSEIPFPTTWDV